MNKMFGKNNKKGSLLDYDYKKSIDFVIDIEKATNYKIKYRNIIKLNTHFPNIIFE